MPDEIIEYQIKTTADLAGSKATAQSLNQVGGASEEAGKKADKHVGHLRAMHKIFHSLNEVLPGLGVLMQAAFSPVGAAISLAVLALRYFREEIKKVNEYLDKMAEENAKPLTNRLEAQRESVAKNALGLAEMKARLADAARGEETMAQMTARATKEIEEAAKRAAEIAQAENETILADLEATHAAGLLSDQEYFEKKLKLNQEFIERKRQQDVEAERQVLLKRETDVRRAEQELPGLHEETAAARAKRDAAAVAVESLDKAGVYQRRDETEKKLNEFEAKHNEEVGWFEQAGGAYATRESLNQTMRSLGRPGYGTAQFGNFDEWQRMKWAADAAQKQWTQFPALSAKTQVTAADAEREFQDAQKRELDRRSFVTSGRRDLPEAWAGLRERYSTNAGVNREEHYTNQFKSLAEGQQKEKQLQAEILRAMQSGNGVKDEVLRAVNAYHAQNEALKAQLKAHNTRIGSLENRDGNNPRVA